MSAVPASHPRRPFCLQRQACRAVVGIAASICLGACDVTSSHVRSMPIRWVCKWLLLYDPALCPLRLGYMVTQPHVMRHHTAVCEDVSRARGKNEGVTVSMQRSRAMSVCVASDEQRTRRHARGRGCLRSESMSICSPDSCNHCSHNRCTCCCFQCLCLRTNLWHSIC